MPGISVTTGVRVGPTGSDLAPASTFFIAGTAQRGPTDKARLVVSMSQFEAIYGSFTSDTTLHDYVKTYFEEGGTRCYVSRAVGTGAATATVNVVDASAGTSFTLTAKTPGDWANTTTSPAQEGLKAFVGVASGAVSVTVYYQGDVVFTAGPFSNETQPDGSTKYAKQFIVEAINASPALAELVTATVGASVLAPAEDTYELTGGLDNSSAPTATEVAAALVLFDYDLGAGVVATPGWSGATVWNALRDHASANRRVAYLGFANSSSFDTTAEVLAAADDYWGSTAASREQGSYMAFFWPWVTVPDGFGSTRAQSPEAFAAAGRARAHVATGPWRAGAGELTSGKYVTGLAQEVTRTMANTLDAGRVNALRVINGSVRVYGARSISADETNWRFITYRDTLNYVTAAAEAALEPLVFKPIDGRGSLFGEVEAALTAIMEPVRIGGGLYEGFSPTTGQPIDPGYSVDVSTVNNPTGSLAQGTVTANVGVRVSPVADKYQITITKSTLTAAV